MDLLWPPPRARFYAAQIGTKALCVWCVYGARVRVCVRACASVCVCVCLCACMCMCVYVYVCVWPPSTRHFNNPNNPRSYCPHGDADSTTRLSHARLQHWTRVTHGSHTGHSHGSLTRVTHTGHSHGSLTRVTHSLPRSPQCPRWSTCTAWA